MLTSLGLFTAVTVIWSQNPYDFKINMIASELSSNLSRYPGLQTVLGPVTPGLSLNLGKTARR